MLKGFLSILAPSLFTVIASCSPVTSRGNDGDMNDVTVADSTPESNVVPEPERGGLGASILGPHNVPIELQNLDALAPPVTDNGNIPNTKWSMALSPQNLQKGGWYRQQNVETLPIAKAMAGVNMRLEVGATRELHWHRTAEWAYVLSGYVQVTSVDQNGRNFIGNVGPGDLWYFPPGIPHSLQATNDTADGAEFLLVFDDGNFSPDSTFGLTSKFLTYLKCLIGLNVYAIGWLTHVPKEVIAKNFQMSTSTFNNIPTHELYIFPASPPSTSQASLDPQGVVPNPFTFSLSRVPITSLSGGSIKVVDSATFTASKTIAAAEVVVEPRAMRELHWHPTQDEWTFFLEGNCRMTLFAAQSNARTWNFQVGDIAYVPASYGHYVENTGNTTLKFLELTKTDRYQDVSLAQWLALTPPAIVQAHLGLSDEAMAMLNRTKQIVVGPPNA